MKKRAYLSFAVLGAALSATSGASAQTIGQTHLPVPGASMAANDDASAIRTNPANLAFLPGAEARWSMLRNAKGSRLSLRGHAFDLASPLAFGVRGGLRLDLLEESNETALRHRWLTWGLARPLGRAASLGLSSTHSYSDDARLDGFWGLSTSLSLRPSTRWGFSATARNWNQSSHRYVDIRDGQTRVSTLGRAYEFGIAWRPLGQRSLQLGVESIFREDVEGIAGRATLAVNVPYVGRLRGDFGFPSTTADDLSKSFTASAGLEINAGAFQASGGALFGMHGNQATPGYFTGLALRGYGEPGIRPAPRVLRIRIEKTPNARQHVRLLRALWKIAKDKSVEGVVFQLKTEPASSLAHSEELTDALRLLRASGKKTMCHIEDAGGRSLHFCSQTDRLLVNPAGGLRFSGLRSRYMYFAQLLKKLGVQADFVRIGSHKTAPEQFTNSRPTPVADADHRDLLNQFAKIYFSDVGGGRKIPVSVLRKRIAKGPFLAKEAKAAQLVDGYAFDDELGRAVDELFGEHVRMQDAWKSPTFFPKMPGKFGLREHVAIIYVNGDMIDGRSRKVPLLGTKLVGSYTIAQAIEAARKNKPTRAIVLRVESPGGSSMAADVMWREVMLAAKDKPVVVSMGSAAASGGYYIAAPGTKIFANRSTITGSIGIFYGKADISSLLSKIGVSISTYRTNPRADAETIFRPFTEDERKELGRKVKGFYDVFIDRVSRGRKLTPAQVDKVARGRVWTGQQAKDRKLVDEIGGLRQAIAEAERLGGLPRGATIVELPEVNKTLIERVLKYAGLGTQSQVLGLPTQLVNVARALSPFFVYSDGKPMARQESFFLAP